MIARMRWYHGLQVGGLMLALAAGAATRDIDLWGEPHTPRDDLLSRRVECPRRWGVVPLYGYKPTSSREDASSRPSGPGAPFITQTAGVWEWHSQAAKIGSAGDITNIPEFHDCQRFVSQNGRVFDSLFAIFASFRLDSITKALWDSVTWSSDKPTVATVTNRGVILGVSTGTTTIVATSTSDASRRATIEVHVGPKTTTRTILLPGAPSIDISLNDSVRAISQIARTTVSTLAAATIYNYGPEYTPLSIKPNFSCLYLYFDHNSELRAKIVRVDDHPLHIESACLDIVDPNVVVGQTLPVTRLESPPEDVPAVARWDFDSSSHQYYIGIGCDAGWCEIGKQNPQDGSISYLQNVPPVPGDRVVRVKGWYDEQNLAWKPDTNKPAVPSGVVGTVIPVDRLGEMNGRPAFKTFVTVAYIALDTTHATSPNVVKYFKEKLNLLPVPVLTVGANPHWEPRLLNRMELCFGSESGCRVSWSTEPAQARCPAADAAGNAFLRWYVRITPAGQPDGAKYRCVTRREHRDLHKRIPGTTRWRWILDDETVWTECTQGCCQTETGRQ